MAISLTHTTTSAEPDSGDGKISSNAWNEAHTLTMAADRILGRTTAGTGAVEELTAAGVRAFLDLEAGTDFIGIGGGTYTGDVSVPDEAYGSAWNASVEVPTKNAVYDRVENILHPGFVAANWYPLNVGFASGASQTVSATAIAADTIYYIPFVLARQITVSDLGARVTTAVASAKFRVAIYANNASTARPTGTPLAETGDILTGGATGTFTGDITGANVTLAAGIYWAAFWSDSALAWTAMVGSSNTTDFMRMMGSTLANTAAGGATDIGVSSAETFAGGSWPNAASEGFSSLSALNRMYILIGLAV